MNRRLLYLPLLSLICLFISLPSLFSQSVQDSVSNDSLNKAFKKQVLENNKAIGIDTTYSGETDTVTFPKPASDSVIITKPRKPQSSNHIRRFYWNERRANEDSLGHGKKYRHNPLYAALFSMALPGFGQAYNRKYWKIPIVYAGFAGLGYAIYHTGSNFYGYRNAYRLQVDGNPNTYGSYQGVDDVGGLK
jgi:hypothetical protein